MTSPITPSPDNATNTASTTRSANALGAPVAHVSPSPTFLGRHPVTHLRHIALAEGVSFLLLLLVAMPLKYMADWPWGVRYIGWVHGVLFMALLALLLVAFLKTRLPLKWAVATFIASLIPLGPFVIDHKLKGYED